MIFFDSQCIRCTLRLKSSEFESALGYGKFFDIEAVWFGSHAGSAENFTARYIFKKKALAKIIIRKMLENS